MSTVAAWVIVIAFAMVSIGAFAMALVVLYLKFNEPKEGQHVTRQGLHRREEPEDVRLWEVLDGDPEGK